MSTNPQLTKDWIQYLKNNQLVELQSDPISGKLKYKRAITTNDIDKFLRVNGRYSQDMIDKAISSIIAARSPNRPESSADKPRQRPQQKKYNNNDAEDINYRDRTTRQETPGLTYRDKNVNEDFIDKSAPALSEKEVEEIFNILAAPVTASPATEPKHNRAAEIKKLKHVIRYEMSDQQRKSLWRVLTNE